MSIDMLEYTGFDYFEERLPLNIQGVYHMLLEKRAAS